MSGFNFSSAVSSLAAQRNFGAASGTLGSSLEKLATGSRINRGADDPAGLLGSEMLRASLAQLDAQSRSIERTDSFASVADGALAEVSGLLNDASAAAVLQANTAGTSQAERDAYQLEIDSAQQAAQRIVSTTEFNGQKVLDGSATLRASGASLAIPEVDLSNGSADGLRAAADQVAALRGQIGAFQKNTLEPALRAGQVQQENTAAAYSLIRDTNYAAEGAQLARARVLRSSALAALALANSESRSVLGVLA